MAMTIHEAREALPRWAVTESTSGRKRALSPNVREDGISVLAPSFEELVDRVRALECVIAIAAKRAGRLRPDVSIAGIWAAHRDMQDEQQPQPSAIVTSTTQLREEARAKGYEGDACTECGMMTMVRNGSCLKCMSCGSTSGCS